MGILCRGPLGRNGVAVLALMALGACGGGLDFDMRGNMGDNFSTAEAARSPIGPRPEPDDRGVISYPNYQVAVAQRGDTVGAVANRLGLDPVTLARFNGVLPEDQLRAGEILALPQRVSEPSPATGAFGTGPIQPPAGVDITELAGNALDDSGPTSGSPGASPGMTGIEPVRHQVVRGETIFTISRLYDVPVRPIAEWNQLDRSYTLREGQFLLIPVSLAEAAPEPLAAPVETAALEPAPQQRPAPVAEAPVSRPGAGSPTPTPPSASRPLPSVTPPPASAPVPVPAPPQLATTPAPERDAEMVFPVQGSIIRDYQSGVTEGIDISAPAGSEVKAAASGVVAMVTADTDNVPIVIVRHPDNLLTVYARLGDIAVKKDDRVSRGQAIGKVQPGSPPHVRFEVRRGFDSIDPMPFLQ